MTAVKFFRFLMLSLSVSGLIACGGGGGDDVAGIGGTGITASGSITGFGSIFVNGVKYETTGASIIVEGNSSAEEDDLRLGMVVKVSGSVNADGLTGTAISVEYDSVLQGPVSAVVNSSTSTKTLTIFGVPVSVSSDATEISGGITFNDLNSLTVSDIIEVSGYFDETPVVPVLRATHLDYEGISAPVKVKGRVVDITPATLFDLDINGDDVADRSVETSGISSGLYANELTIGDYVEVTALSDAATIMAQGVELEEQVFGDLNGEASLEGIVTGLNKALQTFVLNRVTVNYGGAFFEPASLASTLANGMQVEVEGSIIGGSILNADEVEAEDEVKLAAFVSVDPVGSTITLRFHNTYDVDVVTDGSTQYEDDVGSGINSPADISASDFLIVEGYQNVDGSMLAAEIKRVTPEDELIQGPVSACGGGTITILGVTFNLTDGVTEYFDQNETPMADSAAFCNLVNTGTYFAEIKDEATADGTADEAELED